MRENTKSWDHIRIRWPFPICYYPPIWELVMNRDIKDKPVMQELIRDEPILNKVNMTNYYNKRIKLTKDLINEKKLDSKIGETAINHFENHLNELQDLL